jgi:hypothetical protein
MVIDHVKALRPYARVLVYGAGSDVLTMTCTQGAAGPVGPPGGAGAKVVTPSRIAELTTIA